MKEKLIRWQKFAIFVLALCLIVPALAVPVRAASSITVVYGTASQSAGSMGDRVWIEADKTQYPYYDPDRIEYEFIGWLTDPRDEYYINLLDNPWSSGTFLTMSNFDVTFIADFHLEFRPAMPTITGVYPGNESFYFTFEPSSDTSYPPPTHYILTDGHNIEVTIPGDATDYNITGLENGSYYYFSLIPIHNNAFGKSVQFVADPYQPVYDVVFFSDDSADPTILSEQSVGSGDLAVQPADPVREGSKFLGWYHSYDTSLRVDFSEPIWGNTIFIAKWEELPKEEKVKVTFDSDGGTAVPEQEIKEGETVVRPPHPVKDGFTFFGWFNGDTRYDFRKPVEADLALKARWQPVGKPIDLDGAIGPEGHFDGELSRAIGLSGTYDATQFRVLPAYPYPSIRLELIDTPDAAIVFSSLPNFRMTDSTDAAGPNPGEEVISLLNRLVSLTHFEQKCVPDHIVRLEGINCEGIGDDELAYVLYGDEGNMLLANDFVTYFPASTGIIHLEYPEENAELTKGRLIHALSTISFAEGTRPAVDYAAFDLALTDVSSVDQIVANLTKAESFFDKNLTDLRLNAELAEHICYSSGIDINMLAMAALENEKSQGNESISKEKQTELEAEFGKLSPFGFKTDFPVDDAGNTYFSVSFSRSISLARYREFLPASYSLLVDSCEKIENVANEETDLNDADQWLRKLRSATELCLLAADPLVAGDAPEWRDPVLRRERAGMTISSFNSSFFHHANDDATLNQAVYDAWTAYEEEIKEIEAGLPAGYFASRIGPYANFILEFKKKVDENGLAPFTYEETEAIFREMDFYNNNLLEQND